MLHAVTRVVGFMEERGFTDAEKLRLLGSVSRLKSDAVLIKGIFESEGLTEEEQKQAIRIIRAMIKARKAPNPKKAGGRGKE